MKKRKGSSDDDDDVGGEKAAERAAVASAAASGPFNNPFAALKAHPIAGTASTSSSQEAKPAADTKRVPGPARAVVRMERKGHGGKDVTVVEQLGLNARDLERWLKSLKSSLGCGGTVDGASIVLQGDHRERLKQLLADRGVKKISVG